MNIWTDAPPEWRALFVVGVIAALLVASLLIAVVLEAAQSTPVPEGTLKRDQATRERQRWLRYLGYLEAQRQRLLGERGQKKTNRPELEAAHGFDTKYAMHILRLGFQGVELMTTGRLTLPMAEKDRAFVYATRLGEVPLQDVLTKAGELERQIKDLLDDAPVPAEPAREEIEAWMLRVYLEAWKARRGSN